MTVRNHQSPPFGMDREVLQVRSSGYMPNLYPTGKPHMMSYYPSPNPKPACFLKKSANPCSMCPWKEDCANAEKK